MRLLLDTHVFLWATATPENLSGDSLRRITDARNDVYVSSASAWEIAIKYARGKLPLPSRPTTFVPARMKALGFLGLPIAHEHALALDGLPKLHSDPFDRVLVAQAQVEGMTLVTVDANVLRYKVALLDARP